MVRYATVDFIYVPRTCIGKTHTLFVGLVYRRTICWCCTDWQLSDCRCMACYYLRRVVVYCKLSQSNKGMHPPGCLLTISGVHHSMWMCYLYWSSTEQHERFDWTCYCFLMVLTELIYPSRDLLTTDVKPS